MPGTAGTGLTDAELADAAREVGFPVLLKPSAGGGGKGMHVVGADAELADAIAAARREARGSFGDDTLLLERYVTDPRHVEIQVLADAHGAVVHLGERECSLQRRHQKVVEEAPSTVLDEKQRDAMGRAAVDAALACGYVGAGTVEFVTNADASEFYFLEMNTRLQVEHPVTEEVVRIRGARIDLVAEQLRVAAGEPLGYDQDDLTLEGHAVEVRLYAEDPARGFLPTGGRILALEWPEHARVDAGVAEGSEVGSAYDPMLAKIIAHGPDRASALDRLDAALGATTVLGVGTNLAWLRGLLADDDVRAGRLDTGLIGRRVERATSDPAAGRVPDDVVVAAALDGLLRLPDGGETGDPFDRLGGGASAASPPPRGGPSSRSGWSTRSRSTWRSAAAPTRRRWPSARRTARSRARPPRTASAGRPPPTVTRPASSSPSAASPASTARPPPTTASPGSAATARPGPCASGSASRRPAPRPAPATGPSPARCPARSPSSRSRPGSTSRPGNGSSCSRP